MSTFGEANVGMFLRPLDGILGSQSKVALLRVLLDSQAPLSGREAARLGGLAHSGALRALRELVELGVVRRTETPGQQLQGLGWTYLAGNIDDAQAALVEPQDMW
jgi:predicted transcriptional regulator